MTPSSSAARAGGSHLEGELHFVELLRPILILWVAFLPFLTVAGPLTLALPNGGRRETAGRRPLSLPRGWHFYCNSTRSSASSRMRVDWNRITWAIVARPKVIATRYIAIPIV